MVVARRVDEALAALRADPNAALLAGGTDLMVDVNFGRKRVGHVIALDRIEELREMRVAAQVRLGAGGAVGLSVSAPADGEETKKWFVSPPASSPAAVPTE